MCTMHISPKNKFKTQTVDVKYYVDLVAGGDWVLCLILILLFAKCGEYDGYEYVGEGR